MRVRCTAGLDQRPPVNLREWDVKSRTPPVRAPCAARRRGSSSTGCRRCKRWKAGFRRWRSHAIAAASSAGTARTRSTRNPSPQPTLSSASADRGMVAACCGFDGLHTTEGGTRHAATSSRVSVRGWCARPGGVACRGAEPLVRGAVRIGVGAGGWSSVRRRHQLWGAVCKPAELRCRCRRALRA